LLKVNKRLIESSYKIVLELKKIGFVVEYEVSRIPDEERREKSVKQKGTAPH